MPTRRRSTRLDSAVTAIGGALGRVAAKVQKLERQRAALATELRRVIDTAEEMLGKLVVARRRARRAVRKVTRRRKRRLSAQGREHHRGGEEAVGARKEGAGGEGLGTWQLDHGDGRAVCGNRPRSAL